MSCLGQHTAQIDVVYPKKNSTIGAVDSSFILGSVSPAYDLFINGIPIPVQKDGGFLAFLPINPGNFEFNIEAVVAFDTRIFSTSWEQSASLSWPVYVPEPVESFGYDSLQISDTKDSAFNQILVSGDRLIVEFQATPACNAWFSIPGIVDSVPMAETAPQSQAYWGETVFGVGAVPDSLMIKGKYRGFYDIGYNKIFDSTRICYFLAGPNKKDIFNVLLDTPAELLDFDYLMLIKSIGKTFIDSSSYFIQINPDNYPCTVELIDSVSIIRVGPRKGYLSIFQPKGVNALAVGREAGWIKLKLSQTQFGWIQNRSVRFLEDGSLPEKSYVRAVRTYSDSEQHLIEIPLSDKHPFQLIEKDRCSATLKIYGANSDTDWIRYDFKDDNIDYIGWSQPEPDIYQLDFKFINPIWGYDIYYESNTLKCIFNKQPNNIGRLKNKKIVVDPGHSPDPGAIGPTRLTESEANLNIALQLKKELEKKGAIVIMTRDDNSPLPLYDRPKIAKARDADLFISIHNNALPDGVDPYKNNGVSTYYYHLHSLDLAKSIQREIIKGTGFNNYGLYHGNLAVNRPTQYPAVLVECAFIILPEHEALLKTNKFQKKVAKSIRKGIEHFFKEYK
ncbi:MAG: N-acetylmuramoyl-L-alanine amidase [candidate division Zixibacteria bacterium]|nr:N-acetylmuramoyl-L-alanine amidase [candidate division Zixibacteria bacterium]